MFKTICLTILNRSWQFLVAIIILYALLITTVRYMTPYLNDYRQFIETQLSNQTGLEFSIGEIVGSWDSLGPVIKIKNILISDPLNQHLEKFNSIKLLTIDVAPLPSLFYRTLVTDRIYIEGLTIDIEQSDNNDILIANLPKVKREAGEASEITSLIQHWLKHQYLITLFDTKLNLHFKNGNRYPVNLDTIHFKKGKNIYQIKGLTKLPAGNQLDFTLEMDGLLSNPNTVANLYIDTNNFDTTSLPVDTFWKEVNGISGKIDFKLWVNWQQSKFQSALLAVDVDDFQLTLFDEPQSKINNLDGYFTWNRNDQGWKIESQQLIIISKEKIWPEQSLSINFIDNNIMQEYSLFASVIDLEILSELVVALPNLDKHKRKQLLDMALNGFLNNITISAQFEANALSNFNAKANFSELSWKPWQKIPGLTKINGEFSITENSGEIKFTSPNSMLDYPALFRWPLQLDSLSSSVTWDFSDQKKSFSLSNLSVNIEQAQLLTDGLFQYDNGTGIIDMNLYAELDNVDLGKLKLLLPTGIMNNSLISYLDDSVKAGTLHSSQIILRGSSEQFPFNNREGVFIASTKIDDTQFIFLDDWPVLNNLSAELLFIENRMDIFVITGDSNNLTLSNNRVLINDFSAVPNILKISNTTSGIFEHAIDYLNNSPLETSVGKIFELIPAQGPFELNLDLIIPLAGKGKTKVDGTVFLSNNSLLVKSIGMEVNNINGQIKISDSLVSAKNLTAEALDGNSSINIEQTIKEEQIETLITSAGEITISSLRNIFPQWLPEQISGQTSYNLKLFLPQAKLDNKPFLNLNVQSTLEGIRNNFPLPFYKEPSAMSLFDLNFQSYDNADNLFSISIDNDINFKLLTNKNTDIVRGQVMLGGQQASIPKEDGIEISGQLKEFDLAPWLTMILKDRKNQPENDFEASDYSYLSINNLLVNKLNYYFLAFSDLNLDAKISRDKLIFNLNSDDIKGVIEVPDSDLNMPIDVNLSLLKIADQFPLSIETEEASKTIEVDTANSIELNSVEQSISLGVTSDNFVILPPIKIQCAECIYNDLNMGSAVVQITPVEYGNNFTLKMSDQQILGLDLKGDWSLNEDNKVITQFTGVIDTNSLENLVNIFNLKSGIRDTSITAEGTIGWQGNVTQFNFDTLFGDVNIKGGKGSQEDISDKNARIFSILSLGSIARKLTLDFSDLFGDGFYYTGLDANIKINDGIFTTSDFKITGTSADIEIVGSSDFANNRIKNCVLVTPDLSASLPVLAGWAIEPVTGLIVFLMSKIFEPALKVITSIQYKIEGSFDAPIVTEVGKSEGTAKIDNSTEASTRVIIQDPQQPQFSCDGAFE